MGSRQPVFPTAKRFSSTPFIGYHLRVGGVEPPRRVPGKAMPTTIAVSSITLGPSIQPVGHILVLHVLSVRHHGVFAAALADDDAGGEDLAGAPEQPVPAGDQERTDQGRVDEDADNQGEAELAERAERAEQE